MIKILLVAGAIYLAIRLLRKPARLNSQNIYKVEEDQDVEYEEIKEE
ncbi:MAG: hypothetical protein HKN76_00070 [Saprospiraceae bacterium]|nr:hypothetical protein [Saprospiraceae bacterium]